MTTLDSFTNPIAPMPEKPITQSPTLVKEEERTIPFLRRLVDMLTENEEVISFCPGTMQKGKVTLGRIVVHDRLKVESNILPRYFNHSSFASLRRQLNYFSFTRLGKGRQRGATYCNEEVMELEDILRLKRRSTAAPPSTTTTTIKTSSRATTTTTLPSTNHVTDGNSRSLKRTSRVSISSFEEVNAVHAPSTKRARHSLFEMSTSLHQTVSDSEDSTLSGGDDHVHRKHHRRITLDLTTPLSNGEDDVLAGCQALLSFASSSVH
ncbi:unnamed protein product [Cylindrotheca closterium]|uniref:HSF-type DNA-binding domain-containing protein n=1 Tax=Cylindrotheca closterium TaxID=2856 RepID=A0AAD2FPN0_9STRA|nr:unnamed protein product [Cylindrotheca closterium]